MTLSETPVGTKNRNIYRIEPGGVQESEDQLVEEAPMEIRLEFGSTDQREQQAVAITMRTPGEDVALALGFLFTEAIIGREQDVVEVRHAPAQNLVTVVLDPGLSIDISRLDRHFYTSSSCGICGKGSLEMVESVSCYYPRPVHPKLSAEILGALPRKLREAQSLFALTGGIHAAGLFNAAGELSILCEDVGRHNAVDKLIGCAFQIGGLPMRDQVLVLSGRIGFELVQKAAMAGIPVIAAVGAPSSLAVELAESSDMTLVGFLRNDRMNVYCGMERLWSRNEE